MPLANGSLRIFRLFGVDVFVHWSWALVAYFQVQRRIDEQYTAAWAGAEYVTLFLIVLLHEFGHALATRSVGGEAKQIVLWPLGGVAYVKPPNRPGAVLWCIAAGPLVNVVLLLPTLLAAGWFWGQPTNLARYTEMVALINLALLVFNLLPFFPLDGGQILRALLWFFVGPTRSLYVAAVVGLAGAAAGVGLAIWSHNVWLILLVGFAAMYSWGALQSARQQLAYEAGMTSAPRGERPTPGGGTGEETGGGFVSRHAAYACPACGTPPAVSTAWQCESCGNRFDPFAESSHQCPRCGRIDATTTCPTCLHATPTSLWRRPGSAAAPVISVTRPASDPV